MKFALSALTAAALVLFVPQFAEACLVTKSWNRQQIAFADVIFEGSLTDVKEGPISEDSGTSTFLEFTFDVHNVVRGELQQDEIVVGWIPKYYEKSPSFSVAYLKKYIGETTRVAISTPQLASLFCELKLQSGNFYDAGTETHVFSERMQPVCDYTVDSLKPAFKEKIPFVLSNGYICGRSYFFPVQEYEDMRNYEENVEAFEEAFKQLRAEKGRRASGEGRTELYRKMVPQDALPWKYPHIVSRNTAVELARDYKIFFTPALKSNADLQDAVLDLGIAMARYNSLINNQRPKASFDRDEATLAKFRESLKEETLRLLEYMERDPKFRNRLLLED